VGFAERPLSEPGKRSKIELPVAAPEHTPPAGAGGGILRGAPGWVSR